MSTGSRKAIIPLVVLLSLATAACDSGDPLEEAKAELCQSAPEWEASLQATASSEGNGNLQTELAELSTGVEDATVALEEAGADALAERAGSFGNTVEEIAAAVGTGAAEAAEMSTEALTDLEALTTLADCES